MKEHFCSANTEIVLLNYLHSFHKKQKTSFETRCLSKDRKRDTFKALTIIGATRSYFMLYSCVVIILFNTELYKSAFSAFSLRNKLFVFLCSVFFVCSVFKFDVMGDLQRLLITFVQLLFI